MGGRIGQIVTPSTSFGALRRQVNAALGRISVQQLESPGSLNALSYAPDILCSLEPGDDFHNQYRIQFASPTIKQLVMAVITQYESDGVVAFLNECDRFSCASSLLAEVFGDLWHRGLAHGGEFAVKRLTEGNLMHGDEATFKLKPAFQQQQLEFVHGTKIDYGQDEYCAFVSTSQACVDAFISSSEPPNELMPRNLLFQYPVGSFQLVPSRISSLFSSLRWDVNSCALVFVVPSKRFDDFEHQMPMEIQHGDVSGSFTQQFALKFGGSDDDEWPTSLNMELLTLLE